MPRENPGIVDDLVDLFMGGDDVSNPRVESPSQRRNKPPRCARKRYASAHWGLESNAEYHWPDAPDDLELTEMGKLKELHFEVEGFEDHGVIKGFSAKDILCFSTDNSERLYLALAPATKRWCKRLWNRRAPVFTLDDVAQEVGGRQARYPWDWGPTKVQEVGPLVGVVYKTHKRGDGPSEYVHEMGEWGGVPPMLCVSPDGGLWLAGGSYTVPDEGITR